MKPNTRILQLEEYISHLSKDAAIYSNELKELKQHWPRIQAMAETIAHAIPDIGTFSRKKRLRAYQVVKQKIDEVVERNIISSADKGHVLLLLNYSIPDFKKAFDANTASMGAELDGISDASGNFLNTRADQENNNHLRDPGERVKFNKKYIYRMHVVVRIFFIALFTLMILEENDLTSLMPSGHIFYPVFTIAFFIVIPLVLLSPYRNSYIELREHDFILPSLYIPPFRKKLIQYRDVLETKHLSFRNSHKFRIKTRSGTYSVNQIHFIGYELDDFSREIEDRVHEARTVNQAF
jgi:hypothetical protein